MRADPVELQPPALTLHKDARKKDHRWPRCELHASCISPRIEKFTIGIQDELLLGQLVTSLPFM